MNARGRHSEKNILANPDLSDSIAVSHREGDLSATERRSMIARMVMEDEVVYLPDLVSKFQVTETSIRRDLTLLENAGRVVRIHGGAILPKGNVRSDSFSEKMQLHNDIKQRIGKAAAEMIRPHDILLLDSGTTTLQIVKQIPSDLRIRTSITLVTNSLPISQEVLAWPSPNLIVLGGIYLPDYQATAGPQTMQQLNELTADCVFLGTDGLTLSGGVTTANILMAEVDRMMVERSRKAVLVTDSSKFGKIGFVPAAALSKFQLIITDTDAPMDLVTSIRELGVEVVMV
ncbi:MAG: DeoR/GlpR family DNA-binding transcription regulator [Anaerolineaceae bacterium]